MAQRRLQQVAEAAERVRADRLVLVVADHRADVALVRVDVEVVEPEPGHLLLQLVGRIEVAQQRARLRPRGQVVHRLLIGVARRLLLVGIGDRVGGLVLRVHLDDQLRHRLLRDRAWRRSAPARRPAGATAATGADRRGTATNRRQRKRSGWRCRSPTSSDRAGRRRAKPAPRAPDQPCPRTRRGPAPRATIAAGLETGA